ncbi:MAG: hypothetical protein HF975_04465 [ANME-2 cluster archaeon]|nr:hypothetical protein [ANME-2 cluster archaeon]
MTKDIIALLIEWDPATGKRAGNINPKDPKLQCSGWQNIDIVPAVELRLVEDDRDLSHYKGIKGVTLLEGRDRINAVIDDNFPSIISIEDELLYTEHFREQMGNKNIKISSLPDDRTERLKLLKDKHHIKGIREIKPMKV